MNKVSKLMTTEISATLFFIFIISISQANAQLHLGAKGGANLTKVEGKNFNDEFELGFQAGGFLYFELSDFLGLQTEVLFNQTNTEVTDDFSDVFEDALDRDKTLNYVSVPLLLRLNSNGIITVNAGPQFSFLANRNQTVLDNGKKLFKRADFSAVAGVELNLTPIIIYARYIWSFSDMSELNDKVNSQQIQLGIGLRLF